MLSKRPWPSFLKNVLLVFNIWNMCNVNVCVPTCANCSNYIFGNTAQQQSFSLCPGWFSNIMSEDLVSEILGHRCMVLEMAWVGVRRLAAANCQHTFQLRQGILRGSTVEMIGFWDVTLPTCGLLPSFSPRAYSLAPKLVYPQPPPPNMNQSPGTHPDNSG